MDLLDLLDDYLLVHLLGRGGLACFARARQLNHRTKRLCSIEIQARLPALKALTRPPFYIRLAQSFGISILLTRNVSLPIEINCLCPISFFIAVPLRRRMCFHISSGSTTYSPTSIWWNSLEWRHSFFSFFFRPPSLENKKKNKRRTLVFHYFKNLFRLFTQFVPVRLFVLIVS